MFDRILVAIDGTTTSKRAFATAIELAKSQNASLHVLHVVDDTAIIPMFDPVGYMPVYVESMMESLRKNGKRILEDARKLAAKRGQAVQQQMIERPGLGVAREILKYARAMRCDLIVMGTHGRRGVTRLVVGSDAETVLREATVPVLLVRSPERGAARKRAKPATLVRSGTRKRKTTSGLPATVW